MTWESVGASRQNYQCIECAHFDSSVQFENEMAPEAIQCSNCGSGRGIPSIGEMIARGKGMRPVTQEHRDKYDEWTSPKDYSRLGMERPANVGLTLVENNNVNIN